MSEIEQMKNVGGEATGEYFRRFARQPHQHLPKEYMLHPIDVLIKFSKAKTDKIKHDGEYTSKGGKNNNLTTV
ncbi:MAG: hypothetical protein ACO3O0_07595 [Bacteroidia bacterium]